ncbi:MAG: hypothetical protein JXR63_10555 [Spirochaetales bacterium]|nr:hypothetical protein [Spirochaetales bacterium]
MKKIIYFVLILLTVQIFSNQVGDFRISNVYGINSSICYLYGSYNNGFEQKNFMLKSLDSGKTWAHEKFDFLEYWEVLQLYFLSDIGFCLVGDTAEGSGGFQIYKTIDNGKSWRLCQVDISTGSYLSLPANFYFVNQYIGYFYSYTLYGLGKEDFYSLTFYSTVDSGSSWQSIYTMKGNFDWFQQSQKYIKRNNIQDSIINKDDSWSFSFCDSSSIKVNILYENQIISTLLEHNFIK